MFGAGTAAAGGMAQNQTPEISMVEVAEDCWERTRRKERKVRDWEEQVASKGEAKGKKSP